MKHIKLFEQWLTDKSQPLLLEGGAAGHMKHPFDNKNLTFGDFKNLINSGLSGELNFEEAPTEKTDGQNLFATIQDGEVKFARNQGEMRSPLDLQGINQKFDGHASKLVQDTFQFAAADLANLLIKLPVKTQDAVFDNGKNFMNMELIYSKNPNVIHYDIDVIQFHGIKKTDGDGKIIGDDPSAAKKVAGVLKKLKSDIGKTFTIIPPKVLALRKDINFDANTAKFIKKVEDLKNVYNLTDADEVSKYHEMWWIDQIEATFPELSQDQKKGLLLRWAYGDKKTLNIRALDKDLGKEKAAIIKKFDKEDVKKKQKENIRPFEDLFLELGSVILKNASNFVAANPTKEMQRLHKEIKAAAAGIKKSGDLSQIEKVTKELERLDRIGGVESIIPTEGLVFKYKGTTYKLTGTFAAINQLMGIMRYGR